MLFCSDALFHTCTSHTVDAHMLTGRVHSNIGGVNHLPQKTSQPATYFCELGLFSKIETVNLQNLNSVHFNLI